MQAFFRMIWAAIYGVAELFQGKNKKKETKANSKNNKNTNKKNNKNDKKNNNNNNNDKENKENNEEDNKDGVLNIIIDKNGSNKNRYFFFLVHVLL